MSENASFIVTLATAILGGGVSSAILTSVFDSRKTERLLLRNKLEELYTEFDKQARNMKNAHRIFKQYAQGSIDLRQCLDEIGEFVGALSEPTIHRVESLSAIYFSEVTLVYKSYLTARKKFSKIAENTEGFIQNTQEFKVEIVESYDYLQEMEEATRKAILRCAQKINRPFWSGFFH